MNIIEYRALKAQMEEQTDSQGGEQTDVQTQQTDTTPATQTTESTTQTSVETNQGGEQASAQTESSTNETTETQETQTPTHIEVNGEKVPIEELTNGYLRQSDYTRKTQELARERQSNVVAKKVYEAISSNPELANQLKEQGVPIVDPKDAQIIELNNKLQDIMLEKEVESLKSKYDDFDTKEVLQFAYDNKYHNLEDAYLLLKTRKQASTPASGEGESIDVNTLTEQIRQQVLSELQSTVDTSTIIQSGGDTTTVQDNIPTLSEQELKIARNFKMSPEEYVKWRDKR